MPFVMKERPSYLWPIKFKIAENGSFKEYDFEAEFRRLPRERVDEIIISLAARDENYTDKGIIREVLVGWKGVMDDKKKAIPFNEQNLDELLSITGSPSPKSALIKQFFASQVERLEKN